MCCSNNCYYRRIQYNYFNDRVQIIVQNNINIFFPLNYQVKRKHIIEIQASAGCQRPRPGPRPI